MQYILGRALRVNGALRQAGEPVPEAAKWRNLRSYLALGHVRLVEDAPKATSPEPNSVPPKAKPQAARKRSSRRGTKRAAPKNPPRTQPIEVVPELQEQHDEGEADAGQEAIVLEEQPSLRQPAEGHDAGTAGADA